MSIKEFFVKIFAGLFLSTNPEHIKKKKLSTIVRNISRTRFSKWYKNSHVLTPAFAEFFFEIYRTVGPARVLFDNQSSTKMLKMISVEESFSEEQRRLASELSEESILLKAKELSCEALETEVHRNLNALRKSISGIQREKANQLYHMIESFASLARFDYYYLLKKFDTNIRELDFTRVPLFNTIPALSAIEQIHNFLEILLDFPFDGNWSLAFTVIEKYKNIKAVNPNDWKKIADTLKQVRNSLVIENIIRHVTEKPDEVFTTYTNVEDIFEKYLNNLYTSSEKTLLSIKRNMQLDKAQSLIKKVFATEKPSSGTKYYRQEISLFKNTNFSGFVYGTALSYLRSFLIEYFKTEIRTLSDLFLLRAIWKNPEYSKDYSEAYHELFSIIENINKFDENLKEGEPPFMKLKASISRSVREQDSYNFVARKLNELNASAYRLIVLASQNLITIAKLYRLIIEDYDRSRKDLLENWTEIENNSSRNVKESVLEAYDKIISFVKLEQILTSKKE